LKEDRRVSSAIGQEFPEYVVIRQCARDGVLWPLIRLDAGGFVAQRVMDCLRVPVAVQHEYFQVPVVQGLIPDDVLAKEAILLELLERLAHMGFAVGVQHASSG
jgi:hypothetical protein